MVGLACAAPAAMLSADHIIDIAGTVRLDSTSLASATTIEQWLLPLQVDAGLVVATEGSAFAGYSGSVATMNQSLQFGMGADPLWVANGYSFTLDSAQFSVLTLAGQPFLIGAGMGTITGNGITPTPAEWAFSTQGRLSESIVAYSSRTAALPQSVPDGGSAIALLGLALGGMEVLRRRRKAIVA
jgi:hypothetical protein